MKDYSQTPNQHPQGSLWKTVKAVLTRWVDRERELASLRNAVGMMSEARQSDSREYHEMVDLNRDARADANRLRWLCADHQDPDVRERVESICKRISKRSLSGTRMDIDANMEAQVNTLFAFEPQKIDVTRIGDAEKIEITSTVSDPGIGY